MSQRTIQINELLRSHLGEIFSREISFKEGVLATITRVSVTPDLRHAAVSVSAFPEAEANYVLKTLKKERGKIQKNLNRLLYMKPLPILSFSFDPTESKADEIERILKTLE
jgi:ribosome-binding factor A